MSDYFTFAQYAADHWLSYDASRHGGRVHLKAFVQAAIWPRMLFILLVSSHAHFCFYLSSEKLCLTTQSNLTLTIPGLTSLNSSHPKGVIVYYTFDNNSASPSGVYAFREHKHLSSHVIAHGECLMNTCWG